MFFLRIWRCSWHSVLSQRQWWSQECLLHPPLTLVERQTMSNCWLGHQGLQGLQVPRETRETRETKETRVTQVLQVLQG